MASHFHNLRARLDVRSVANGLFGAGEGFVLYELESAAVIDQRISGNAGGLVVGAGEAAVNHHQLSASLAGILATGNVYGNVAVDDVAICALRSESIQNAVAHFGVVAVLEIIALLLGVHGLICEEITFEGGHAVLAKEGTVRTAPQIPEVVPGVFAFSGGYFALEGASHNHAYAVHQFLSGKLSVWKANFFQTAVCVEGDGSVEKQVAVADIIHTSVLEQTADVALQLVAHAEGVVKLFHQFAFLRSQAEGVGGIDGGQVCVAHLVVLAFIFIYAALKVDVVKGASAFQFPFGMLLLNLGFQFELYDGDGLVHLGQQEFVLSAVA